MNIIKTGISINKAVFEALEKKRGRIPRSTYVNDLIKNDVLPDTQQG